MKLVRDRIPKIIQQSGGSCEYHVADLPEFKSMLFDKIDEEVGEFRENPSLEEAADVYEVIRTLLWIHKLDIEDVIIAANEKSQQRGGFNHGIVLDSVEPRRA
jgi:predicted house-cleaning noncanonical NTP pyrophosphatase (MazG superfamily)